MHINGHPFSNKLKIFTLNISASNQFNCRYFDKKDKKTEYKQMKRNNEIDLFLFFHVSPKKQIVFNQIQCNHRIQSIIVHFLDDFFFVSLNFRKSFFIGCSSRWISNNYSQTSRE